MEILLFERQLEIMQVLWERGSASVAEVVQALDDNTAYTTVLTMLRRLEEKGYVGHVEEGRTHRWYPKIQRLDARESALERLTHGLFQGSPEALLAHLVSQEKLTKAQLRRLKNLLQDRLGEDNDKP